jgi:hypothetical protein
VTCVKCRRRSESCTSGSGCTRRRNGTFNESNSRATASFASTRNISISYAQITGNLNFSNAVTADSSAAAPLNKPFADKLKLKLVDQSNGSTAAEAVISSMGVVSLAPLASLASRTYIVSVEFPDGGGNGADNDYKGASLTVDLNWETTS